MYSQRVIARSIERFAEKGIQLTRHDVGRCDEMTEALKTAFDDGGKPIRSLNSEEKQFIINESLLTQIDYHYWKARYAIIELDGVEGGGIGHPKPWKSQEILLDIIAKLQEQQTEAFERGEPVDGILIADHKARQVGHTEEARMLMCHRNTRFENQRCAAISVDEEKVGELYRRDKGLYDNLPVWLKPGLKFDVKNGHLEWSTGSRVEYFQSNKQSSLGQGKQFDFGHATELSEYIYPDRMDIDFFPTLPQNPNTLCILESRANGRGNWWHHFSEKVRKGRKERWTYCFVPWYAEPKKYRRQPPAMWQPSEVALLHAKRVYETSPEFLGKTAVLSPEQLYWWESTRKEYAEDGKLNLFLTNYCETPESSFQHTNVAAFSPENLEWMRLTADAGGVPFEFEPVRVN